MKSLGSNWSEITRRFRLFFFFSAILALTPHASAGSGQLTVNPSTINFGSISVGTSQAQTVTLTNSGGSKLTITQASLTGTGFTLSGLSYPVTLAGGQSVSCYVTFIPPSSGPDSGSVSISFSTQTNGKGHYSVTSGSSGTITLPVSGAGAISGQLIANSTSLGFGNVQVGTSQTLAETITNSGGTSVTISAASATGSAFNLSGLSLPMTLNAGQSATFSVAFAPTSGSSASGNLAIASNASNPALNVPLSGTGITPGQLTTSPTSLGFGNVQMGTSQTLAETITNSGGASVTISAASATGSAFNLSGLSLPMTLNAGQSATFSVAFAPTSGSSASGNLAITSNASNPALNVPLSGTGITPGQLTTSPTSLGFGNVQVGTSQTLAETITNSGGTSVTISAASATGSAFNLSGLSLPMTLNAGQSATFSVAFAPTSGSSASGNLAITSNASNPALNVPLSGTGITAGQLTANPVSLSFGSVATGRSTTLAETLTNSGGSALTISQITPSGTGFTFSGINLPLTLAAAQSVTFNASFAPQSAGSVTGGLMISSNGSNPSLSVPSTGTGTSLPGQLTVAPLAVAFGNVSVGTTQSQAGTLTASSAPVTVSSLGVSGSQFSVSGITLPVTIAAGNSVSFQLTFAPQSSGSASANVTFASNASNSPSVESLTGSGTPPQHSVALGWNTSTSTGVDGYNIYRATASTGPFTRINSALDSSPFDTDSTVQGGQTYYYVVTAVDSTGAESSYSSPVQAVVPSP